MMKKILFVVILAFAYMVSAGPGQASAFQGPGCAGKCADCHNITNDEASKLLKVEKFKAKVKSIRESQIKGLWEVEVTQGDKTFLVYVDYAKKYLVEGKFTALEKLGEPPPLTKVDPKKIPLDNALVYGNPKAEKKVIVFDDPECPFCRKLHEEIKKINAERKDIVFYVKMYPLPIHPDAYEISKSIICGRSPKMLDDAFAGKKLPKANCETAELDNNIKLAGELGIKGTPGLILPDGRLFPGYAPADTLLDLIDHPDTQKP